MKIRARKLLLGVTGVLLTMICTSVFAGGWSGQQVIKNLNFSRDKLVLVVGLYGPWDNPSNCDTDAKVVLDPAAAQDSYDEAFAMVLSAHMTGREVAFFLSGCTLVGSKTVPVIKTVAVH